VAEPTRVVILGGGFAGLETARQLECSLAADRQVAVTLISRDNFLLFTPMLAEVAVGAVAPSHVAVPLRSFLRRVQVWQAEVGAIDLDARVVTARHATTGHEHRVPYDQLVLALGAVSSYHGVPGAAEHTLGFKTLADAAQARARVVDCFEQAALESEAAVRRALLTFVVAGGGYTGVELAAALADFLRELRRYYPPLARERLHLVLAHHGPRLLEELPEAAAAYTLRLLQREGIAVRLHTAVSRVAADHVELQPGGTLPTYTVFWAAGVAPNPLVEALPLPKSPHGAVAVDRYLAVPGHAGVWALGDCAAVPNPRGGTYGPTAQNAERQAAVVAHNLLATLRGAPLRPLDYQPLGMLASLGRHRAVGRIGRWQFAGFSAWLLWRTVYLAKLPSADRRLRVGLDWLADLLLPPDIVNTAAPRPSASRATVPGT
jgi:NADH dehydrogenase